MSNNNKGLIAGLISFFLETIGIEDESSMTVGVSKFRETRKVRNKNTISSSFDQPIQLTFSQKAREERLYQTANAQNNYDLNWNQPKPEQKDETVHAGKELLHQRNIRPTKPHTTRQRRAT